MKHLKTTIKLSVLALACLGAGALTLQPTAYAKAEDSAACLTMQNGAAVCVSDDFSGIRWTTKIDFDQYQMLCGAGKTITFGTLVMPTDSLGDDGVLTEADVDAVDIVANVDVNNLANDTEYYSIINYDKLAEQFTDAATKEESLQKAYALELTARSYVKVNDTYYFTDMTGISTSRSARQVALAAELAGDWTEGEEAKAVKAASYYGMTERYTPAKLSNGAAGTAVIDLNEGAMATQQVELNIEIAGNVQSVFVGTERVEYVSYADKKFTFKVTEGQAIPTGENYVFIYTDSGFYTEPIIGATKILKTVDDLKMFNAKGGYYDKSVKVGTDGENIVEFWNPAQEQSGYYVLGADIDANAYVHGSRLAEDVATKIPDVIAGKDGELGTADDVGVAGGFNNSTWNAASSYEGKPIGLTGTFNGLGHTIDGMTMGSTREGFFGIVNGGTVKNVAFTDVKSTQTYVYVIANYLIDATIDNVYIATNTYNSADKENNPGFLYGKGSAILANTAYNTTISNSLLRLNKWSGTSEASTFGALFGSTHSNESFTFENVFVYVRNHFKYITETITETEGVETKTYKEATAQYYTAMVTKSLPKASSSAITTKGVLYLAENQILKALGNNLELSADAYDVINLTGVYYYGQKDTWGAYDPAGFLASGCWTAESGVRPAWGVANA